MRHNILHVLLEVDRKGPKKRASEGEKSVRPGGVIRASRLKVSGTRRNGFVSAHPASRSGLLSVRSRGRFTRSRSMLRSIRGEGKDFSRLGGSSEANDVFPEGRNSGYSRAIYAAGRKRYYESFSSRPARRFRIFSSIPVRQNTETENGSGKPGPVADAENARRGLPRARGGGRRKKAIKTKNRIMPKKKPLGFILKPRGRGFHREMLIGDIISFFRILSTQKDRPGIKKQGFYVRTESALLQICYGTG